MRTSILTAAALAAGVLGFIHGAGAAPLTATYQGTIFGTSTAFEAVFHYDTDNLTQDSGDSTLFNGTPGLEYATLTTGGMTTLFSSSDYFYERVISQAIPNYEFGIRQDDGAFLYLKLNGATQEGRYDLQGGVGGADLDPARVIIESAHTVAPVPLPPTLALFAGSVLALGLAGSVRRRVA